MFTFHDKHRRGRGRSNSRAAWAWAAGIFEGEGSIVLDRDRVRLQVKMTDLDVLERLRNVLGGKLYGPYQPTQPKEDGGARKPAWIWSSDTSDPRAILDGLWPWLGERRRQRVQDLDALTQGALF